MKFSQTVRSACPLPILIGLLLISGDGISLAQNACQLNSPKGAIQHVIYVQFDNTHFRRDNANVPSDLEQMPHLLNFITGNGVLMSNDHTVLISHTATGILTSLTGVYPDRMGQPVSNSFRYFKTDGTTRTGVSFAYWTAPLFDPAGSTTDTTPEMINENGKIAPAPWVPFTRAGCDFGAVATANTILENTAIDIPTVFGSGSPEAIEVAGDGGAAGTQSFADFVGIGKMRGVGWAICYQNPESGRLSNHWITLHETGNVAGYDPILVMDVWEHAYLLDYKPAERPKYIEAFFSNIDWTMVEKRLQKTSGVRTAGA